MSKGQHRNWKVNITQLRGKLLPPRDAGVKSMFKITLEIKGRNSVWASGVRRKSQCERGEIKVKTSKLPQKTTDKLAEVCFQCTLTVCFQRQRNTLRILRRYSLGKKPLSWIIILFSKIRGKQNHGIKVHDLSSFSIYYINRCVFYTLIPFVRTIE